MYTQSTTLKDHESLMRRDNISGELSDVIVRQNNIPEGMIIFEPKAIFRKDYTNSWKFVKNLLSPIEFIVIFNLALLAKANTNSLEPLNDTSTIPELMEFLQVSKNKVNPILKKLFNLGVYGKFEYVDAEKGYTKYWLLNPYLSFSGKVLHSDIARLFKGTHIAKAFYNPDYKYKR